MGIEELVRYIVENLVDDKSLVDVQSTQEDDLLVVNIIAEQSQIGRIIGKQGRIAKAIRTIVRAKAINDNIRVSVEITERQ